MSTTDGQAASDALTGDQGGGDGTPNGAAPSFMDQLSDDSRAFAVQQGWDKKDDFGPDTIVEAYRGAQKLIGNKDLVELPTPDNIFESHIWDKFGAPADASGYQISRPDMPDGMTYDENLEASVLEVAAAHKMLPQQVQPLVETFANHMAQLQEATEAARVAENEKYMAALQAEWGNDFEANMNQARQAATALGIEPQKKGDDSLHVIDQIAAVAGNDAAIKLFHKLGGMLGEDVLQTGDGPGGFAGDAAAAKAELEALNKDPDFLKSINDRTHPDHAANIAKRADLYKAAYPG